MIRRDGKEEINKECLGWMNRVCYDAYDDDSDQVSTLYTPFHLYDVNQTDQTDFKGHSLLN